jgi:uncharacterized protein (TIGR03118 family)
MKSTILRTGSLAGFLTFIIILIAGCQKIVDRFPELEFLIPNTYTQVNLVADQDGYGAARVDPNLVNAWGMAFAPSGPIWVSATETGLSFIFDGKGANLFGPITIPSSKTMPTGGSPTGQVFNGTSDFVIKENGDPARFIFVAEDGIVSAWNGKAGSAAIVVNDRSPHESVYKGVTIAWTGKENRLYATDFKNAKVDVFDKDFNYIDEKSFQDPTIPSGYAPFNIQNIDNKLFVTYARQKGPDNEDDDPGLGRGFVNVFRADGTLERRFASRGQLNSPWGVTWVPQGFLPFPNAILIGNFGDGLIHVFNFRGERLGVLTDKKLRPIWIDGLWSLGFPPQGFPGDPLRLFFTAGPGGEEHGLFGYIGVDK